VYALALTGRFRSPYDSFANFGLRRAVRRPAMDEACIVFDSTARDLNVRMHNSSFRGEMYREGDPVFGMVFDDR
jgi:hypothetical protein